MEPREHKIIDFDIGIPPWEQAEIDEAEHLKNLQLRWIENERNKEAIQLNEALKQFGDYLEMAEKFIAKQPIYYDKAKLWWVWDFSKNCWMRIDETDLMIKIDEAIKDAKTIEPKQNTMILEALRREGRKNMPSEMKKSWIQLGKKIIDIETNEIIEPSSKYFSTNPIPWEIGDSEDTPTIDRIFVEWVGERNKILLYQIIAYCLMNDYPIHRIFCLIGSGCNGKTKFLELLVRFIGRENICSTELDTLISSRFELAKLYKKLVCIMGETNFNAIKKTSVLKKLTGQDFISFEFKNKTPFDGMNYAKIIIATNSLPITYDKTDGYYRRWQIVEFNSKFTEQKDPLKEIPSVEYNNLAKKCIRILGELLKTREFHNEGSIEHRKMVYEDRSDFLQAFICEYCDIDDLNAETEFAFFYRKFMEYSKQKGYRELTKKAVGSLMRAKGFESRNKTIGNTSISTIVGLKFKESNANQYW